MARSLTTGFVTLLVAVLLAHGLMGCQRGAKRPPRAEAVTPVIRDVPTVLRGIVGAESTFGGTEPVLVTGYGLVVGLNGTGGGSLPEAVAATMEREMSLRGVGRATLNEDQEDALTGPTGLGRAPTELLRDPRVAVVVVYAQIPPGSPEGMAFDVFVQALNATSLDGGKLWTTDLRIGRAQPFGGVQSRIIAQARGPIYVNPYTDREGTVTLGSQGYGRVLNGAVVTQPLAISINMDNPSHARVRSIVSTINSRFPPGPGDLGPVARGRDDSTIALTVPSDYVENPSDFVKMVQAMPIDTLIPPEEYARRYVETIRDQPSLAADLEWSLKALGPEAISQVRELYTVPELTIKLVGLRAGAALGDGMAATYLLDMARSGPAARRIEAIRLLDDIEGLLQVDLELRKLVNDSDPAIRIAAYETLAARARSQQRQRLAMQQMEVAQRAGVPLTPEQVRKYSQLWLPRGTPQGVSRELASGKFLLDRVAADRPMIYSTQQGEPRLAIFGEPRVSRPLLASAWDDRFMLVADTESDPLRLFYRHPMTGQVTIREVSDDLEELVRFLAHKPTPEDPRPGLDLSYSAVVGAMYAVWEAGGIDGEFITEQDRLLVELAEAARSAELPPRPEGENDDLGENELPLPELPTPEELLERQRERQPFQPRIVPINPTVNEASRALER